VSIPTSFTAGDSVTWNDPPATQASGSPIRSPEWSVAYYLRFAAAGEGATVTGVADAVGGWDFAISATTTAGFDAGVWSWSARATSGALAVTLRSGTVTVQPSLVYTGTPTAYDGRSQAEKDLEAVRQAIRTIIAGGVSQYSISNRQATKLDLGRLMERESDLKATVAKERAAQKIAAGLGDPRNLFVRFGR
jgi:hypothetical protein